MPMTETTRMPITGARNDLAVVERAISTKPSKAQDRRPLLEIAERDQGRRMRRHDLGLLQRE
jgi:hypothetical protein